MLIDSTLLSFIPRLDFTIRWDKLDDNITGYQIAYKRVGSESYKCKTYKGSLLTKKTLKGFSGGTYYFKIRTYKIVNGKRIYSSWSNQVSTII